MRMKSLTGKPAYVVSKNGFHCIWIDTDWTEASDQIELDQYIKSMCISEGALQEGYIMGNALNQEKLKNAEKSAVLRALKQIMESPIEGDITAAGTANLKRLATYAGIAVTREMLAEAQETLEAEKQ